MKLWIRDKMLDIREDLSKAHKSLTIIFNSLMLSAIEFLPMAKDSFPELQEYLPADIYKQGMLILVVGNIILRFKTQSALRAK